MVVNTLTPPLLESRDDGKLVGYALYNSYTSNREEQTVVHLDMQTDGYTDRHADRRIYRQTCKQMDR